MILLVADFGTINTGSSNVYYTILNPDKTTFQARTKTGVTEIVASTGIYGVSVPHDYIINRVVVWDIAEAQFAVESFSPLRRIA